MGISHTVIPTLHGLKDSYSKKCATVFDCMEFYHDWRELDLLFLKRAYLSKAHCQALAGIAMNIHKAILKM